MQKRRLHSTMPLQKLCTLCSVLLVAAFLSGCNAASDQGQPLPKENAPSADAEQKWFEEFIKEASGIVRISTPEGSWALSEEDSAKLIEILRGHKPLGQVDHFLAGAILIQIPNRENVPGSTVIQSRPDGKRLAYGNYSFSVPNGKALSKFFDKKP
jgi:hypothetical protein